MVARAMCIIYYGQSCARNKMEAGHCMETEQKLPFCCMNGTWKLFYDLYCMLDYAYWNNVIMNISMQKGKLYMYMYLHVCTV